MCALKSADLTTLDTPTKQMVFYSNILNFLYIHSVLLVIAMETNSAKWEGLEHLSVLLSEGGLTLEVFTSSQSTQTVYFTKVGYFIGQLGLISCFDLHHTILSRGLAPPTLLKDMKLSSRINPCNPDPWAVHAPLNSDPRLVFVVSNGCLSSPSPLPLTLNNFEEQLVSSEAKYLSSAVKMELSSKDCQISVPEWLCESIQDLFDSKPTSDDSDLSLLKYIQSKLDKEKGEVLQTLIGTSELSKTKKISVTVRPSNPKIGFDFRQASSSPSPQTSPKRAELSRQSSRRRLPRSSLENREIAHKYNFTPEILEFVNQHVCLLAALVHLLSPPTARKTSQTSLDEKNEQTVEESVESSVPPSGKKGLMETLRSKVSRAPSLKKPVSVDTKVSDWQMTYDEVLSHFAAERPMYQYLVSRLSCFNSLIQWDGPPDNSPDSQKDFKVCLRTLAALPSSSDTVGEACSFAMRRLFENGRVMEAVDFLSSEPVSKHPLKVAYLSDIVLSCAFVSNYLKTDGGSVVAIGTKSPLAILSQISDPELASRLTLASLKYWPVGVCMKLLSYCHSHLPPTSLLVDTVKEKLDCMKVYSLIMDTCESPLHRSRSPWKKWYEIAKDSEKRPDYVLQMLLSSRAFAVARQWAAVHAVGQELSQQIEVEYLSNLLEGDNSDPIAAQQVGAWSL